MKNKKIILLFLISMFLLSCGPPRTVSAPTKTPTTAPPDFPGETLTVTSTADSGPGTLRQALLDAQDHYTIIFDPAIFPPDEPNTITFISDLPFIEVDYLTLDASNAGVILDGSQIAEEWHSGLQIVSGKAIRVMGMQISKFPGSGIAISGNSNNNLIGGDRSVGVGPFGRLDGGQHHGRFYCLLVSTRTSKAIAHIQLS